jgi:hypothetical protein
MEDLKLIPVRTILRFNLELINLFFLVARLENVSTSDKETQIDHISMLKEYDIMRYQNQQPDQFRPFR